MIFFVVKCLKAASCGEVKKSCKRYFQGVSQERERGTEGSLRPAFLSFSNEGVVRLAKMYGTCTRALVVGRPIAAYARLSSDGRSDHAANI